MRSRGRSHGGLLLVLVLAGASVACNPSSSDEKTEMSTESQPAFEDASAPSKAAVEEDRRPTSVVLPDHPLLERLVGEWMNKGIPLLRFSQRGDGKFLLETMPHELWEIGIDEVGWEGDRLYFVSHNYAKVPNSPYHAAAQGLYIWPTDDPDELGMSRVHPTSKTTFSRDDVLIRIPKK